jgi:hypothetical protein
LERNFSFMPFTIPECLSTAGLFFATGLSVGFGHCIGMCGPIAVSLSLHRGGQPVITAHLLYNLGRVSTYGLLGAVMGFTGSVTGIAARMAGMQKGIMILAGLVIITMGIIMGGGFGGSGIFKDNVPTGGFMARTFQRLSRAPSLAGYLPLGLVLGLLPCGPVYAALVAAARASMEAPGPWFGAAAGAGLMIVFGLGTFPALLLVGRLAGMRWLSHRRLIYRLGALTMILMGGLFIYRAIIR